MAGSAIEETRALVIVIATSILLVVAAGWLVSISVAAHATDTEHVITPEPHGITNVAHTGTGIAIRQNNTTYVWQDGNTSFEVTILPYEDVETYRVCLNASATAGANASTDTEPALVHQYGCEQKQLGGPSTKVTFELDHRAINGTGPYRLVATLRAGEHVENESVPIYVIERGSDLDGDGLQNEEEIDAGTGLNDTDTDADGLQDGSEVDTYGTAPTEADTDADGLRDAVEIQRGTDPTVPDTDDDQLTDGDEIHKYGTDPLDPDTDEDGISDGEEVEGGTDPTEPNTAEGDTDDLTGMLGDRRDAMYWLVVGTVLVVSLSAGVVVYSRFENDVVAGLGDRGEASAETDSAANTNLDGEAPGSSGEELVSPETRVQQLLEENDGRIKQTEIVEMTDWSKAKVSRTLSRMENEGEIVRTQIGRENLVTPPEEAPDH